jgi:2-polyprenyl-3-methyl-5-hydroxy-6-metoxy-1,4-benzoquinol methylase
VSSARPCPACLTTDSVPYAEKNSYRLVRCRECATLFTHDDATKVYDDYYDSSNLELPGFLARRIDEIVAGFGPSGRLLDVGFGAGTFLEAGRRAGWSTAGVEVSLPAVEHARANGFDVFHGRMDEASYTAGSFDVVVATEIFEHICDVRPLLQEIARVLRPGGLLWATTPHGRGISRRLLGSAWSVMTPPEHVQLFSISGIRKMLRDCGFGAVVISAEGFNPFEILDHFRRRTTSSERRVSTCYELNQYMLERPSRRALKVLLNRLLSQSRLGDSLKIAARMDG